MVISVDVPDTYLVSDRPTRFGARLKLYAGVDRFTFAAECQRHGVPLVDYPAAELEAELLALRSIV